MKLDYQAIKRRSTSTALPMKTEFDSIKGKLRDIAENMLPSAVRGLDDEVENITHKADTKQDSELVCTIPLEALRKGAAGFLVNLMNPARQWYHLKLNSAVETRAGTDVNKIVEGLQKIVDETMHKCGAYVEFKRVFEQLLAFGFSAMLVTEDKEQVCRAECLRIGTYALGTDHRGNVNRLYRRFAMTPEEVVREFGGGTEGRKKIPNEVISAWKRGDKSQTANIVICNLIEPNEETYAVGSDEVLKYGVPKSKAYRSIYWIDGRRGTYEDGIERDGILDIRGFQFNPIIAPRLSCENGDIYGRGRGHDALNACRAIQGLRMDELEISSNRAEPPLIASNDLREEGLKLGRGEVTYANIGEQRSEMVMPVLPNPPTSDETRQTLVELQQEIRACMFNDEFATIDSLKLVNDKQKRTAAEINALTSENMLLLAGVILMLDTELLDPTVKIFTSMVMASKKLQKMGVIPEIPNESMTISYVSNLHVAQMTQEINSVRQSIANTANLVSLGSPKTARLLDHFDFDRIVRRLHTLVGAGAEYLKDESEVEKIRMAEDAAAADAAKRQQAAEDAKLELERQKAAAQAGRAAQSNANAAQTLGDPAAQLGGFTV